MHVSYPENPVSLGDKIRKKRMDLKLLQKDVAKILGVTEDSITNWEKNRSVPQIQFFPVIIQFLEYLPFDFDLTTISGKLKTYRHLKGISQKRLGTILNVDGATVCSWEQNEFQPYEKTLKKLIKLFDEVPLIARSDSEQVIT